MLKERSERIYVATKTSPDAGPWPPSPYCKAEQRYSEDYLRANVEQRLTNLGTDCIDVLQLHTWTRAWNNDPVPLEILARLRDEGKLRLIGLSTPEHDQNSVIDLMRRGLVDVVQVIYNLFEQEPAAELLPVAAETGTAIIGRVVFDEGVLTGKYQAGHRFPSDDFRSNYFAGDRLDRAVNRVEEIRRDVAEAGLVDSYTLADVAIKFVLRPFRRKYRDPRNSKYRAGPIEYGRLRKARPARRLGRTAPPAQLAPSVLVFRKIERRHGFDAFPTIAQPQDEEAGRL